jgi:hypothetical protein
LSGSAIPQYSHFPYSPIRLTKGTKYDFAYQQLMNGIIFSGELKKDIEVFFEHHNDRETYEHTLTVVKEAVRIARLFDADQTLA